MLSSLLARLGKSKTAREERHRSNRHRDQWKSVRLLLETLENRLAPDGNVSVTLNLTAKTLTLTGDALGNEVQISYDGNSQQYTITGIDTLLNGDVMPLIFSDSDVHNIVVRLNQGDDNLEFTTQSSPATVNLNIDLGGGNDVLTFHNSNVDGNTVIRGRQGNDQINSGQIVNSYTTFNGNVTVLLEQGDDILHTSFEATQAFNKNFIIDGGSGNDSISIRTANILLGTLHIKGSAGDDFIRINDSSIKKLQISAGTGGDFVGVGTVDEDTSFVYIFTTLTIQGDSGDDTINVGAESTSQVLGSGFTLFTLKIFGGAGNDTVKVGTAPGFGNVNFNPSTSLADGGPGTDTYTGPTTLTTTSFP
ncbi:MAG: hypothetical protein NZM42_10130 [Gemmatales bacterium]|nr:hypothetical protein [Gemmatales bacterium]